jgi:hypothetical protein
MCVGLIVGGAFLLLDLISLGRLDAIGWPVWAVVAVFVIGTLVIQHLRIQSYERMRGKKHHQARHQ